MELEHSPLARRPVKIHYREFGEGIPLVFLHGGWGYHLYPINKQLHHLKQYRVLIPDRSGYGQSSKPADFDPDFHSRAAEETLMFLDALGIDNGILWGHSDGSIIAVQAGLRAPERCRGLIMESFHYWRRKSASRQFFEVMATTPESFGERVAGVLAHEHGDKYWRELITTEGRTWLDIAKVAETRGEDLFDGEIGHLRVPAEFIHGARDPRTDPGELTALQEALPSAHVRWISNGEHCPHSEKNAAEPFTTELLAALAFIERCEAKQPKSA